MGLQRPLWAPFEQCMGREAAGVCLALALITCTMMMAQL